MVVPVREAAYRIGDVGKLAERVVIAGHGVPVRADGLEEIALEVKSVLMAC